jgi:hypothetical protein
MKMGEFFKPINEAEPCRDSTGGNWWWVYHSSVYSIAITSIYNIGEFTTDNNDNKVERIKFSKIPIFLIRNK